ncbi:hypothetical protein R6Q57_018433 [Mikania cordata]
MELDDERIQKLKPDGKGNQSMENPNPLEVCTIKKSQEIKEFAFKKRKVIAIRDWPPGCGPATSITMVHISDELIVFEILTRVPTRTVGHSKCVSKKWKALLLTPQFVKIHCSLSLSVSNQIVLLVDDLTCSTHQINFQSGGHGPGTVLYFPFNNITIYSHLDGLLCLRLNHTSELALWNPVTGSYKLLSTHDRHGFFEHNVDAVGLYIDAFDDYKVLHIGLVYLMLMCILEDLNLGGIYHS